MMSRSSNKNRFNNFPLIGSRQSRLSRQNYSPKVSEKCMNCKDYGVCASCLTCSNIMCVNCALMHSKDLINHRVMDIKEAYRSSYDIIKQMEHKIRLLMQNIKPNPHDQRNKINGQLFEDSFQKIKNLRKQIEQLVTSFFEQIQNNYLSMWNSFVEVWGSGSALKDRMSSTQKKLQGYLFEDQLDEVQCLVYLFNNQLIEETQSLIEAWERKQNTNLDFEQSQILIPPRAQFDLTHLTKLEFDLNLLVQIISWNVGQQDIISIEGKERATIPIFPVGSKSMFIYHTDTREYQLGDFPDLKAVQMPFFSKQILIDDNNLFVIGGSDSKGVPMKSVIQFKDGDLVSLPSIPQGKNPSNGLVYDNDVIYVIGGMKIIDDKIQWCKSCEMYLIKENKWMSLEEMKFKKPFQTVFKINNFIYALGQQLNDILNFEKLDLTEHNWQMINIQNHSINPYMFGLGYLSATINSSQVLIFGGKQFIKRTIDDTTVSTDEDVIKTVFLYDINLNQFISLGDKLPGTGVNYGDYAPIVLKNKVIYLETPLAKVRKLQRWLSYVNIIEISLSENGIESSVVQMLTPE